MDVNVEIYLVTHSRNNLYVATKLTDKESGLYKMFFQAIIMLSEGLRV